MTHRQGVVCVRDREILRKVTCALKEDGDLAAKFEALPNGAKFHSEDLQRVYHAYLHRVETMMGGDRACMIRAACLPDCVPTYLPD